MIIASTRQITVMRILIMSNQLQLQTANASESMDNGFLDDYKNIVSYFRQNPDKNLDHHTFTSRTNRATNALISGEEAIWHTDIYSLSYSLRKLSLRQSSGRFSPTLACHYRLLSSGCVTKIFQVCFYGLDSSGH